MDLLQIVPDDVFIVDWCWDHVQLAALVDGKEQLLVEFVGSLQAETHQADLQSEAKE